jgi:hypothetical protein
VFYGSNLYRKDNPRWAISNAAETPKVLAVDPRLLAAAVCIRDHSGGSRMPRAGRLTTSVSDLIRSACGTCAAWLVGLPRRAGIRLHAMTDAEARWWHWQVTERCGGLVHQYLDARFEVLRCNPAIRRDEVRVDLAGPDPAPPGSWCDGDLR